MTKNDTPATLEALQSKLYEARNLAAKLLTQEASDGLMRVQTKIQAALEWLGKIGPAASVTAEKAATGQ